MQSEIFELIERLFPICRSITGDGVRQSLEIIKEIIPLDIHEVPSGAKAFDWQVPKEWNIKDAYISDSHGNKIIDFKKSNLHIVSYSQPVNKKLTLKELKEHLYSLPDQPDIIPYRTSYYSGNWGFCLPDSQLKNLAEGTYEVMIDSSLQNGSLTYGEYYLPGSAKGEVVISTYLCHPSMCNDNLSGPALVAYLAKHLSKLKTKYSYRFLFIPETIGALAWLNKNEDKIKHIRHGLVATCCGDRGNLTYKRSRSYDAEIDRTVIEVLEESGSKFKIVDFFPSGSDERQFSSPGFNLPFGSLMRTMYGQFPEYHTSADNLNFVSPEGLNDSFAKYVAVIQRLEQNQPQSIRYLNLSPKGEPQLGRRGLYKLVGASKLSDLEENAKFWVLNYSDGQHSLLDIAYLSGIDYTAIQAAAELLHNVKLLERLD